MFKIYSLFPIFLSVLCLTGCVRAIEIDVANKSSDLTHCENLFGKDLKTLKYENTFLLQTGTIDTTDEHQPIPVAIVIVNKKEVILKLVSHRDTENENSSIYEGDGYKINLNYKKEVDEYHQIIFKGHFTIERKEYKSEYDIVGINCNL